MKRIVTFAALLTMLVVLAACNRSSSDGISSQAGTTSLLPLGLDSLVGTYAVQEHGKLENIVRVEKKNGQYFMSDYSHDRWSTPYEVTPVKKEELDELFKKPISVKYLGLGEKDVAIFKMPAGWESEGFKTTSGYWLAMGLGPVELFKR